MKRSRVLVVLAAVVVAAVAFWFFRLRGHAEPPRYRTATVEAGDVTASVSATGTVRPVIQVQVGSQVSGTISELGADFNSRVRKDQMLAQIEPSSFRTRVVQAEASLAKAEAALQEAQRSFKRAQELLDGNYVSQADVDAAASELDQRKADRQQAEAQLASARVDLQHTTIRSPIDGVVISRSVDVGQTVAASLQAPQLFVIANDLAQMQVETRIDEADIGRIRQGLPVRFTVDAFPDDTFEGQVSQVRLEPITDQNVVTYTTVMRTQNHDLRLRPGMTANVTVLVDSRHDVLKVPNAALRFRPAGTSAAATGARAGTGTGPAPGSTGAPAATAVNGARREGRNVAGGGGRTGERSRGERPGSGAATNARSGESAADPAGTVTPDDGSKPGKVYVLRNGRPMPIDVRTGITDGSFTEIRGGGLKPGDAIVVGLEVAGATGSSLTPPAGMGGPMFRGRRR